MKHYPLFALLILLCPLAQAQDIILKTDQAEVQAKVLEITTDEVKYKQFGRLTGPTYTLRKSDIMLIIYEDGKRERFGPATPVVTPTPVSANQPSAFQPAKLSADPASGSPASTGGSETKGAGFTYGLGYATPAMSFGEAHGLALNTGFYALGKGRRGGFLADIDAMYFFGDGSPQIGLLAVGGLLRFSEASSFYVGSGLGYGTVSVEVPTYDRLGKKTGSNRVGRGDFGGKLFMGVGIFRLSYIMPTFQGADSGMLTIGLQTSPF